MVKTRVYITITILLGIIAALVISSVAWFSANSFVSTEYTTLTTAESMVLTLSMPDLQANEDAYLGQKGIEYNGLDSPYFLTYSPVIVRVSIDEGEGYYMFCDISAVNIVPIISMEETKVLSVEEIQKNFTWRFGFYTRRMVLNPATGLYEEEYYEKLLKNVNGFLYDEESGEPFRVYSYVAYSFKLYLYFVGEEGLSLLTSTQNNIPESYTFAYSDFSYMWATYNVTVIMGIKDLYTISFDSKGGGLCEDLITTGASYLNLPTPSAPNESKYFGGWYDNETFEGDAFTNGTLLEHSRRGNFHLYAKWLNKYSVSFAANGYTGTMPQTQYIMPGGKATSPQSPVGETIYWTSTPMTLEEYIADPSPFDFSTVINGNITLYAVEWKERYIVTLHMDTNIGGYLIVGGITYNDTYTFYVYEGDTIPNIYTPKADSGSRNFKRWSLKGDAITYISAPEYNFNTVVEGNVDLYAYYGL